MFPRVGPDDRVIEVKYADMADVQSAARGYLAADTPKALELKVAELSPVFGAGSRVTPGFHRIDWDEHDANATERATAGAN